MNDPYAIFLIEFLNSAEELMARVRAELDQLRASTDEAPDLTALMRGFHSLKGNSSFVPDCPITPLAHVAEDVVSAAREGAVDPEQLIEPLTAAIDCIEMRLEEYRRGEPVVPPTSREQEILSSLRTVSENAGGRRPSSRYFFAGEDVTEDLEFLGRELQNSADAPRLGAIRDRLARLAAASGASGIDDLGGDAEPDARSLLRWLADRAVRVPLAKGASLLRGMSSSGGGGPRGSLVPRHFTIDAQVVDEFLDHAVELRVFGERMARLDRRLREMVETPGVSRGDRPDVELERVACELRAVTSAFAPLAARLQARLLAIRRLPVKRLLERHAAMIRDLAPKLGKEVEVVIEGGLTPVDKSIMEQLEAPLTHMVRNAVDHGLESPGGRSAQGKSSRGRIVLRASTEGQWFILEVADDGPGIDVEALRRSAVERGFLSAESARHMSDEQVMHLVFLPGLSCRREVNELSGRGIGMDQVFATVRQLRGSVRIHSEPGQGSRFVIQVPDTGFAVVRCVPVRVGDMSFFIPHDATRRWTDSGIDPERDGPLITLAEIAHHLGIAEERLIRTRKGDPEETGRAGKRSRSGRGLIVVLEGRGRRFGLEVDEVGSEADVVARPIDRELVRAPLWCLAALGEEGETRLVLDVDGLAAILPALRNRPFPAVSDAA